MRKTLFLLLIINIALVTQIKAQDNGFGIGIIAGEPTGLSGKLWLGGNSALDMAAAWSFKDDGNFLLQVDYVWHSFDLIVVSSGKLPLYFGLGGRIIFQSNDTNIGIRVPVGLDYMFSNAPVDIFLELVPILNLNPSTEMDFGGGLGVRYWF